MKLHENACSLPWKHFALGTEVEPIVFPCCRFSFQKNVYEYEKHQSPSYAISEQGFFENIRTRMQAGEQLVECSKCWQQESAGKESMRQKYNNIFAPDGYLKNKDLEYIEISFSNLCNLACRMCNITSSSTWASLYNKTFYVEKNPDTQIVAKEFLNKDGKAKTKILGFEHYDLSGIDLSKVKEIKILGGEPMMMPQHEIFLKDLCRKSDHLDQVTLTYHTNVTKLPSQSVIDVWKTLKIVNIVFSIDGYGAVNDYQRTFSSWSIIEKNIKWYKNLDVNLNFGIHTTLSILNTWKYDELFEWISKDYDFYKEKSIDFVRWPDYLNISYMPKKYKDLYINKIQNSSISSSNKKQIVQFINSNESKDNLWNELLVRMKQLDKVTNKDLTKIIPIEKY
jgi:hypothetical protein